MMLEKGVPSVFPLTCARSMYEPLNRYKYGQFASYFDQMRACVKYFAETKGKKVIGSMYQDTDFGRDVHAGVVAQVDAMKLKLGGISASLSDGYRPQCTGDAAQGGQVRPGRSGTIVKDTIIILQTARKMGWTDVEFCGHSDRIPPLSPRRPVRTAEASDSMSPGVYTLTHDVPDRRCVTSQRATGSGLASNQLPRRASYAAAMCLSDVLQRAGRDLNPDTFQASMESIEDWCRHLRWGHR